MRHVKWLPENISIHFQVVDPFAFEGIVNSSYGSLPRGLTRDPSVHNKAVHFVNARPDSGIGGRCLDGLC